MKSSVEHIGEAEEVLTLLGSPEEEERGGDLYYLSVATRIERLAKEYQDIIERYRAVLKAAEYENIDRLATSSIKVCTALGKEVAKRTRRIIDDRDELVDLVLAAAPLRWAFHDYAMVANEANRWETKAAEIIERVNCQGT